MKPVIRVGWRRDQPDASEAVLDGEWLVTNGLGGYASGTIAGVVTRRYHGLLIAALPNPLGRTNMFDHLAEQVRLPDGSIHRLGLGDGDAAQDPRGAAGPLEEFRLEMGLPVWIYRLGGFVLEKRVLLAYMQNTVFVRYRLLDAPPGTSPSDTSSGAGDDARDSGAGSRDPSSDDASSLMLTLRPGIHFRPHESPVSLPIDPYTLSLTGNRYEVSSSGMAPSLKLRVVGDRPNFEFYPERQEKVSYRWEAARGYEAHGSLWSPGMFKARLTRSTPTALVASAETWETMDALSVDQAFAFENERRVRLLHAAPPSLADATTAELVLSADQFVIAPAGRVEDATRARAQGEELRSVIAGYHWFTDWGRDTMISLEGLTLCTGRPQTAHFILHTFARYVRGGLIPNLFPEGAREGLYHTADATLWYFHALDRYLAYTGDRETLRLLLPLLEDIVKAHVRGTSFGIGMDADDGLLRQGQEGFALTWMDALVEGWVVTPRRGKAVEINALWFNALALMAEWMESERGAEAAVTYRRMAARAKESFNRAFWNDGRHCLLDVVGGSDPRTDGAVRPNQIFAIALPHPVLDPARWSAVVETVAAWLLTPVGLRSLAPDHPDFKTTYHGDLRTRDAAYHQGTVWSWLIGPYIDAWLKVHPGQESEARQLLFGLRDHLGQACVGSVSEIFDAEKPFLPRGAIAQAWGVAELLRAWLRTSPEPGDRTRAAQTAPTEGDARVPRAGRAP
jgi:predicted glycogen debranching enzyme